MTDFTHEWVAKREELEQAATEGPWCATFGPREQARVWTDSPEEVEALATLTGFTRQADGAPDAEWIADARTSLPAAVVALKAVLKLHRPDGEAMCWSCDYGTVHPCPTVRSVEAALRGES